MALGVAAPGAARAAETAEEAKAAGSAAMRSQDWSGAAAAFERAATLAPTEADHWFRLGLARGRLEQWDAAIAAYDRVIALTPGNAMAHNNRANLFFRRGMYEEAAVAYRGALGADPDYLKALFHYGYVLRQLGRDAEAEPPLRHCLEVPATDPTDRHLQVDCRYYLGSLRFRARDFTAAAQLLEQVVAANPGNAEAHYYLAMSYRRLGRVEEAQRELELHARMLEQLRQASPMERERLGVD